MITIREFVKPKSIEEAYELLIAKKNATLIGGGAYVRLGSKNISTAIDLSGSGLDYLNEKEEDIEIGAMVTFGELEHNGILKEYFGNFMSDSVKDIVGVQLRNVVTLGGTVYTRHGFSDPLTALLALETNVKLFKQGVMSLEKFLLEGSGETDILESVIVRKNCENPVFKSMRNSSGDYAILNLAVSKVDGKLRIAVGARPRRASLAYQTMAFLNEKGLSEDSITEACNKIAEELTFGTNTRASKEYREQICKVLLKRALTEVLNNEN